MAEHLQNQTLIANLKLLLNAQERIIFSRLNAHIQSCFRMLKSECRGGKQQPARCKVIAKKLIMATIAMRGIAEYRMKDM